MMSLELGIGLYTSHVLAAVRGEIDVVSSPDAASAVAYLTTRRQVVIVDLSDLEFIDSLTGASG
jgi:anti-anti-sigma factor